MTAVARRRRVGAKSGDSVTLAEAGDAGASGRQAPAVASTANLVEKGAEQAVSMGLGAGIEIESLIFDPSWYGREYPDVAAAKLDPVVHYFDNGFREGRNPNRYFDTNWYASNNPDVAAAGLNPFLHYLLYGAREGRKPAP